METLTISPINEADLDSSNLKLTDFEAVYNKACKHEIKLLNEIKLWRLLYGKEEFSKLTPETRSKIHSLRERLTSIRTQKEVSKSQITRHYLSDQ